MFACPLFRKFCEHNHEIKLSGGVLVLLSVWSKVQTGKSGNANSIPNLIGVDVENLRLAYD